MTLWALAVFVLGQPVEIIDVFPDRQSCIEARKEYRRSNCYEFKFYEK